MGEKWLSLFIANLSSHDFLILFFFLPSFPLSFHLKCHPLCLHLFIKQIFLEKLLRAWYYDLRPSQVAQSKESTCNAGDKGAWVQSLGGEDPLEEGMATHSSILVKKIPWRESLAGYSPWGQKESDMNEWLSTHVLWFMLGIKIWIWGGMHLSSL